jgi:hypothetical protein
MSQTTRETAGGPPADPPDEGTIGIDLGVFELFAGTLGTPEDESDPSPQIGSWVEAWSDGLD